MERRRCKSVSAVAFFQLLFFQPVETMERHRMERQCSTKVSIKSLFERNIHLRNNKAVAYNCLVKLDFATSLLVAFTRNKHSPSICNC